MSVREQTARGARVYRFHDSVAISFLGIEGEQVYIPEVLAHELADLLQTFAEDITLNKFGTSPLGTEVIDHRHLDPFARRKD